jgi:hypothetical protein
MADLKSPHQWLGSANRPVKYTCQGIGEPAPGCGNDATVPLTSHRWNAEKEQIEPITVWFCAQCVDLLAKAKEAGFKNLFAANPAAAERLKFAEGISELKKKPATEANVWKGTQP